MTNLVCNVKKFHPQVSLIIMSIFAAKACLGHLTTDGTAEHHVTWLELSSAGRYNEAAVV